MRQLQMVSAESRGTGDQRWSWCNFNALSLCAV